MFLKKAHHLIRAIILGAQVVGRAFAQAVKNEFQRMFIINTSDFCNL